MTGPAPYRPLADRIAEAKPIAARRPAGLLPPIEPGVEVDAAGYAIFRNFGTDAPEMWFVHAGVRMAWQPAPVMGGAILHLLGGMGAEPGFEEEGVAFFATAEGLSALIDDLQLIRAAMLGANPGRQS